MFSYSFPFNDAIKYLNSNGSIITSSPSAVISFSILLYLFGLKCLPISNSLNSKPAKC